MTAALTVLDLFAGGGSFSRGLHRAGGFRTVAACESAAWKLPALRWTMPEPAPVYPDVETLTAEEVFADVGPVDVVCGSPPCTDISAANSGGRGVDGDESRLFFEFCRLVGEVRPRWFVAENSPVLRTRGADRVLEQLEALGYACWPLVVGAGHIGAPHIRDRVWIIGLSVAHADGDRQFGGALDGEVAGVSCARDAADRRCIGRQARAIPKRGKAADSEPGNQDCDAGDGDGAGPPLGQGERGDAWLELAALERTVGPAVHAWAGGLGGYLRVADGISARAARRTVSLAGDAVVEEVVECIGRAILAVERELRA